MESEAPAVPGYVNHPPACRAPDRVPAVQAGREGGRRQTVRIALVALRAYEQRAERRAALRNWLEARAGVSPLGA